MNEVSITHRCGDVIGRMRYAAAPADPSGERHATPKSQIKNRDRDVSDCERESAFAGAGDKRKAFDNCMKARGY